MKKVLIFVIAILVLSFSACYAQDISEDRPELSVSTIGNLLGWQNTSDQVSDLLTAYGLEVTNDFDESVNSPALSAEWDSDSSHIFMYFYFNQDNNHLWEIETAEIFFNDDMPQNAYNDVIAVYNLNEVGPYQDADLDAYLSDFDDGFYAAGPKTIALMAMKKATDDSYGYNILMFIDRDYFETH